MLNNVKTTFHKEKHFTNNQDWEWLWSIILPGIPASLSSSFFRVDITSVVTAFVSSEKISRMLFTFRVQGINCLYCVVFVFILLTRGIKCLWCKIIYRTLCKIYVRIVAFGDLFRLFKLVLTRRRYPSDYLN